MLTLRVTKEKHPNGTWRALFKLEGLAELKGMEEETGSMRARLANLPAVSLSRAPDHCYFPLHLLQDHDYHAPPFPRSDWEDQSEENAIAEMEKYIARVVAAVQWVARQDDEVGPIDVVEEEDIAHLPDDIILDQEPLDPSVN